MMQPNRIPHSGKIVGVEEMGQIEALSDQAGHSYATMMELAGRGLAEEIEQRSLPGLDEILLLVGPGNNGGDGLVCARYLHKAGITTRVYLWKRQTDPPNDHERHFAKLTELGIESVHADADAEFERLRHWLRTATVVVDALLGTGSNRPIGGNLASILQVVQQERALLSFVVVAADCPSGLNCDSGALDPLTISPDQTITFAYAKRGQYLFPGADICGEIKVLDIGIDPKFSSEVPTFALDEAWVRQRLPERSNNSHKGSFGKAMAAVGCINYAGAAYLSCAAAGRSGTGLITGAVAEPVWAPVATKLTEATWLLLPTAQGAIAEEAATVVAEKGATYSALLVGCGLGQAESTQRFVHALLQQPDLPPLILDADGLNCLAKILRWQELLPPRTILTPHVAELSRLCQLSNAEVVENRWEIARAKAVEWNAVVLAKGPYTVVADVDGTLAVLPVATPALATAGTGDVLAGTIAGLLAQGLDPFDAACLGAWLHGKAGERCAAEIGLAGVLASDVLDRLPFVIEALRLCGSAAS